MTRTRKIRRGSRQDLPGNVGERASPSYLRTPEPNGTLLAVGAPGRGAAGPVFLQVGTASVEPTEGHTYDPTDGATTDPNPDVPACTPVGADVPEGVRACASAAVLESANAVASKIAVSFMVGSPSRRVASPKVSKATTVQKGDLINLLSIWRECGRRPRLAPRNACRRD